jgi:hypothetical protein
MVMVVLMVMLMLVLIVMMVTAAIGIVALAVVVMVVLMMLMLVLIVMMVAATIGIVALTVVVMMLDVVLHTGQLGFQRMAVFHGGGQLFAVQGGPRRGDDGSAFVMLAEQGKAGSQLILCDMIGMTENDATSVLDLIVEELAKVFHIQFALVGVYHGGIAVQHDIIAQHALNGAHNVRQFANARGLDQDAVGCEIGQYLCKGFGKVTNQRTTDAALIHLGDLYAAFLQKSAVNANLTEFIFDQNDLFTGVCLAE